MKTISQKLRKLRDAKGYSQEYVAENMGVSPSTLLVSCLHVMQVNPKKGRFHLAFLLM